MGLQLLDLSVCGASVCGLTELNTGQVEYVAEGGATTGGAAYVTVNPYIGSASGGATTGGSAVVKVEYESVASDGVDSSGAALFSVIFSPDVLMEATTGGSAGVEVDYSFVASDGALLDGESGITVDYVAESSGGAETGGTSPAYPELVITMSGGAVTSGESENLEADYNVTDAFQGGATLGGDILCIFTIDTKSLPVFIRKYDGDVRLRISADGGIIQVWGGQPEMDTGLETAIHISLFTESGWWGNAVTSTENEIGSDFIEKLRQPLTNQARLDIIETANRALKWLTETGIALSVTVQAKIPETGSLALYIEIQQPEKKPQEFRYTINWQNQRITMQEAA